MLVQGGGECWYKGGGGGVSTGEGVLVQGGWGGGVSTGGGVLVQGGGC